MKSQISHKIKHREIANDEFFTPQELVKILLPLVPVDEGEMIMDNAYGGGAWFDEMRSPKVYSNDFLIDKEKVDWYITNPPYSFLDEWLKKSCEARRGFAYLLGLHNLTPKRIEMCERLKFGITKIHLCKVFKWYGISAFIVWEKNKKSIINYDRVVW